MDASPEDGMSSVIPVRLMVRAANACADPLITRPDG
jgi:hypothetical protein